MSHAESMLNINWGSGGTVKGDGVVPQKDEAMLQCLFCAKSNSMIKSSIKKLFRNSNEILICFECMQVQSQLKKNTYMYTENLLLAPFSHF